MGLPFLPDFENIFGIFLRKTTFENMGSSLLMNCFVHVTSNRKITKIFSLRNFLQ